MYRFIVLPSVLTILAFIAIASLPVTAITSSTTKFITSLDDDSSKSISSVVSHVLNFLNIDDPPHYQSQSRPPPPRSPVQYQPFKVISAINNNDAENLDLEDEPADVFVPFTARQVQPTLPPVVNSPTLCTFPELFRRNTRQRAPRNARVFRRYRSDTIVQFNMLYTVSNGVATVRITPLRSRLLRRVGVSLRVGGFQLRRANQVGARPFIRRNNAARLRFTRSFDYTGVSDLPRASRFAACCGQRLTVNMFVRICQLVPRARPRRGRRFREVCRSRLVQPRAWRLWCRRIWFYKAGLLKKGLVCASLQSLCTTVAPSYV